MSIRSLSTIRTTFTFRVACDDIKDIQEDLLELTKRVHDTSTAIEITENAIEKRRKELKVLNRKSGNRKKVLEKMRGKAKNDRREYHFGPQRLLLTGHVTSP
jgi:chromosome segregation ATPase